MVEHGINLTPNCTSIQAIKSKKCQTGVLLGSLESKEYCDSNGTSRRANGQVEGTKTLCQGSKYAKMGTTQSGKHMGKWEMGQESE
jgi:hypothetical protein